MSETMKDKREEMCETLAERIGERKKKKLGESREQKEMKVDAWEGDIQMVRDTRETEKQKNN